MKGPQVFRLQVDITSCYLQCGMTQHPLQPKHIAATADVIYGKTMPERMGRNAGSGDSESLREVFHVTSDIVFTEPATITCAKHKAVFIFLEVSK